MSTETESAPATDRPPFSSVLWGVLHIAALTAIAVAQPLFDILGRNAEFFVARGSEPVDIWVMTVLLVLLIPTVALAVEAAAWWIAPAAYRWIHVAIIGLLAVLLVLQILARFAPGSGWLLIGVSILAGSGLAIAYDRFAGLRSFVSWASVAVIAVPVLFLFFTPVNRVAFPGSISVTSIGEVENTPVVVVVWDEMHSIAMATAEGEVDESLLPNLGRLAADGVWYQRASGVSDATSLALPPIVTGEYPDPDLLPIAQDHPKSLFTTLAQSHELFVREPVTALCPESLCGDQADEGTEVGFVGRMRSLAADLRVVYLHVVLPDDSTDWLPQIDRVWGDFDANAAEVAETDGEGAGVDEFSDRTANEYIVDELGRDRVTAVSEFIEGLPEDPERPPFVFLHAALPHAPYRYAPSGLQYTDSANLYGLTDGVWDDDEWPAAQAEQRYLMQSVVTDRLMGDVLAWLDESGLYDDALVIVTSDHGVGFTPGDYVRGTTTENFGETMSVPMVVKYPGGGPSDVSGADIRTTDVYATVMDVLGAETEVPEASRSMRLEPTDRGPKSIMRVGGVEVQSDPAMPAWDRALEQRTARFAREDGSTDVYLPGWSPLVGRSVAQLDIAPESAGSATVNNLQFLENPGVLEGFSPTHAAGDIEAVEGFEGEVAVALNGRIVATGPLLEPAPDGGYFSFFIPEEWFDPVRNDVEMFAVGADGESLVRFEIPATRTYTLATSTDGSEYLESGGFEIPVTSAISGSVDVIRERGSAYSFVGWAADLTNEMPADEVVVIVDGVSVLVGPTNHRRLDVAEFFGNEVYAEAGFSYELPKGVIDGATSVRVFAVIGAESASELSMPDDNPWP